MVFSNNLLMGAAGQSTGYEIDQSIRFSDNDSARLARTVSSSGSLTTWTLSGWIKRGRYTSSVNNQWFPVYTASAGSTAYDAPLNFNDAAAGGSFDVYIAGQEWRTTALARDTSAWYHVVTVWDSTNGTASDRMRLYVNGERQTDFSLTGSASSGLNSQWNSSSYSHHRIGNLNYNGGETTYVFDGYLAEINFIDGTALDPTSFGETNNDGVWVPIAYTGSYGTNGFYITGETASDLGEDFSGNNNDFTSTGLATTDQMLDTPTKNWCTWNNIDTSFNNNVTSDGNLVITTENPGYTRFQLGTFGVSSGKWEWKWTPTASLSDGGIGVDDGTSQAATGASSGAFSSQSANGFIYRSNGQKLVGGSVSSYGATFAADDVIRCQIDLDADTPTIEFFKNDASQGSINMNAGVTYFPCQFSADGGLVTVADFGQSGFTAAAGFNTLNTANLPTPSITDGSKYFQTTLYTGTGSSRSVDQSGNSTFQPDWVWVKSRNAAYDHALYDALRGVQKELKSNDAGAEATITTGLTAFESDGFQVGSRVGMNGSSDTFVAWQWLANGSGSSNEDGSINTTATSVNTTAGFSISKYDGSGSNATVGHGLGIAPKMVIVKETTDSRSWVVYHEGIGDAAKVIYLNQTVAAGTDATVWNSTAPTSTVFSVGTANGSNGSGNTYIAYAFAEISGYSSIGSYEGNGSTDGPFVYTGFKPAFILTKNIDTGDQWGIRDATRNPFNVTDKLLNPNANSAETSSSTGYIDILSNGFKPRSSDSNINTQTIIYMAFAENPFGGDGVAPATAR